MNCLLQPWITSKSGDVSGGGTSRLRGRWPHHAALKPCQVSLKCLASQTIPRLRCTLDAVVLRALLGRSVLLCCSYKRADCLTHGLWRIGSAWHLHHREQSRGAAQCTVAPHRCWHHDAVDAKAEAAAPPGRGRQGASHLAGKLK